MRGHVDSLMERYVDGALPPDGMEAVERHLTVCSRCARRAREAEKLSGALRGEPDVHAPAGFADSVMEAVYREALGSGARASALGQEGPRPAAWTFHRRLGLSFVLSAAVLAASLLVPSLSYARIIKIDALSAEMTGARPSLVKGILDVAGSAVRGTLGSPGGRVSMYEGGASK
jgi:anti-sigma factor RsiW